MLTFVEGSTPNSTRRFSKIQNDHPSITLHWNIKIDYQDDWWRISSDSPLNGTLNPGEKIYTYVEVDRTGKEEGEHWAHYIVESYGNGYAYDKQVTVVMEVGHPEPNGPALININPNTVNKPYSLILDFDKYIDQSNTKNLDNYRIIPPIDIFTLMVNYNKVTLVTAGHDYDMDYIIHISSITDLKDRTSADIEGKYRFYQCCAGSDLKVVGSSGEYEWDVALDNKRIYTDRNYVLQNLPEQYQGCALLRTSCKDIRQNNFSISFSTNCDNVKLIVAYDPRKSTSWDCDWLENNFTKIPTTICVSGINEMDHFDLYESNDSYQINQVTNLYQNGAPSQDALMYFVLIKKAEIPPAQISGNVNYFSTGYAVSNTKINLLGGITDSVNTNSFGYYEFIDLQSNLDYAVIPSKIGDISRGTILMYDAFLTAQIAVHLIHEPTEMQKRAADVDGNGIVSMYDAMLIARYAVGLTTNSDSNMGRWLFLPSRRDYLSLQSTQANQDFTAIIIGDVDGSWTPKVSSSADSLRLISTAFSEF